MSKSTRKVAFITGASSGIGKELARIHAKCGGDLIIVARRQEKLLELKKELEGVYNVSVNCICQDLSERDAAEVLYKEVCKLNLTVDYLINNAGVGHFGFFNETKWDVHEKMMQLNVVTLTHLTHLFLQDMVKKGSGKILNVGSLAGFLSGPLNNIYYATKAFVLTFSEALDNELKGTGVTASVLCPGPTETEFFEAAGVKKVSLLKFRIGTVSSVADIGYKGMIQGKRVIIPYVFNKFIVFLLRLTPRKLATAIARNLMK